MDGWRITLPLRMEDGQVRRSCPGTLNGQNVLRSAGVNAWSSIGQKMDKFIGVTAGSSNGQKMDKFIGVTAGSSNGQKVDKSFGVAAWKNIQE